MFMQLVIHTSIAMTLCSGMARFSAMCPQAIVDNVSLEPILLSDLCAYLQDVKHVVITIHGIANKMINVNAAQSTAIA